MYDTVRIGEREEKFQLWGCSMRSLSTGSRVPPVTGYLTYSVAARESGYVNVVDCVIESWTDSPLYEPVFDKWGSPFSKNSKGLIGEDYFFENMVKEG